MFKSIRWTLQLWHAAILALALASFAIALYVTIQRSMFRRVDSEIEGAARVLAFRPLGPPNVRPQGGGNGRGRGGGGPTGGFFRGRGGPGGAWRSTFEDLPWFYKLILPQLDRMSGGDFRGLAGIQDWAADLPKDVLSRVGQDERDQPYYAIWTSDGEMIHSSLANPEIPPPPPSDITIEQWARSTRAPEMRWRGELREIIVPGIFGSKILVGRSTAREQQELRNLRWLLIGAGAGVMIVGLAGGWLLSSRAIRPIRTITETARAISASDLSKRIDLTETQSELGVLAQTLNQTFERLDTAFQRQVQFTADASHELRTPLSVIHTHAELALTRERTAAEYRQTLEACLRAARRMKSLVESLLVLARADARKLELNPARFDLKSAAEESVAMVGPLAQERNIVIESDLKTVPIVADRSRVAQLVTNLLSNAIRYNRPAGGVKLAVSQEDSQAVIIVTDTGVGIADEDQRHVFERFFRADKAHSREAGGSGLGLAICQSIVEAHHGTIAFTSRQNEGTTFTVRLPIGN